MGKRGSLPWMRFSCGGCMLPAASTRSVSLNVARFHFSAVFWNRATSCTSVVAEKCRKNRFGGYGIGGKTAFRQEKCCTIRNLPRKSESCNKIRRFLPWFLISWQVLAASAFQYPTVCMIKESVRLTLYRPRGFLLAES